MEGVSIQTAPILRLFGCWGRGRLVHIPGCFGGGSYRNMGAIHVRLHNIGCGNSAILCVLLGHQFWSLNSKAAGFLKVLIMLKTVGNPELE